MRLHAGKPHSCRPRYGQIPKADPGGQVPPQLLSLRLRVPAHGRTLEDATCDLKPLPARSGVAPPESPTMRTLPVIWEGCGE
jgi:hypothetical protein